LEVDPYCVGVQFDVALEPVRSPGALSIINAAQDELDRRYGPEDTDTADLHLDDMTAPRGAFVVARCDGHLAGGVGVRSIGDPKGHAGEIKRLWVRPDLRGSGVAHLVMQCAEAAARELNLTRLYLETGPRQPEAQAFYTKTGWQRVDSFPDGAFAYPLGIKYAKDV